jgi:hypothetical protein
MGLPRVQQHLARSAYASRLQKWRIRVSIPVPRRCERRTLPIELIPHCVILPKLTGVGFEPTPPKRLVPKTSALDHSAIQPLCVESRREKMLLQGLEPWAIGS